MAWPRGRGRAKTWAPETERQHARKALAARIRQHLESSGEDDAWLARRLGCDLVRARGLCTAVFAPTEAETATIITILGDA